MSAIGGVLVHRTRLGAQPLARVLLDRMAHRVPDGRQFHDDRDLSLAQGALRATPEASWNPQTVFVGDWVVVVDGRVDDRVGSFARLQLGRDDGRPDEALFAGAWQQWGVDLGLHVVGDFALAAWHTPSRTLWLIRDRVGVRPLYWVRNAQLFGFASEAEALLSLPGVSSAPDSDRVRYYLAPALGDGDPAGSWYRDVRKLRPGQWLKVAADGRVETGRWWRPQPGEPLRFRHRGEYEEAFREVFGEAVRCRLRAPTTPALMLSGGIDSAAVLAMLRRGRCGEAMACKLVSVVSDLGDQCPETASILRMHLGERDAVRLPLPSFSGAVRDIDFAPLPWAPAHPVDNALLLPMLVLRAVQAMGGRVVLDGLDGDLVMWSRTDRAARLALGGDWRSGWREARLAAQSHTYLRGLSPGGILARGLLARLQPAPLFAVRQAATVHSPRAFGPWLSSHQVRTGHLRKRLWRQRVDRHRATARLTHAEGLAYVWEHGGLFRGMEGMDHLAARFAIEPRHPWSDQRVLDFFLRLPEEQVTANGCTKHIARAACEPWLGREVAWHSGKGHLGHRLAGPAVEYAGGRLAHWLREDGALAAWVERDALARVRQSVVAGQGALPALELGTLAAWMEGLERGPG